MLTSLDWTMILAYAVLVIALGFILAKRNHNAEDYFLAGRRMTWPLIGLSLFASNISSTTLVGLAGDAYSTGISVFNYEWTAAIILVFFAVFILPFVIKSQSFTLPEFLSKRFDNRVRLYFSGLTLFLNIVVDTAASLFAGGLLIQLISPEWDIGTIIAVLALIAGAYTIAGGLAAVMITDAIQTLILMIGAIVISVIAFDKVGGWSGMTANLDPAKLSLIRPLDDPGVPWLGLLIGIPLLGFYFWCANQFMVQRLLSAKNIQHARFGALFAALLKLPVLFVMVLPGTMAINLYPSLERPDLVYPTLMLDLLPAGLLGLVLAGFMAALMSQIDSTLNAASTLVTMDFVRTWRKDLSSHQLMQIGRWVAGIFMLLAALWAPQIAHFESLFKYLQSVLSYTVPPIVAIYLIGSFWRGANATGAVASIAVGTLAGVVLFISNVVMGFTNWHFLYVGPILLVISVVTLVLASRFGRASTPEQQTLCWTPSFYRQESQEMANLPWWQNYRILSVLLLVTTGALVLSFA